MVLVVVINLLAYLGYSFITSSRVPAGVQRMIRWLFWVLIVLAVLCAGGMVLAIKLCSGRCFC